MSWRTTACGVRLYGNDGDGDGDALAYQAWSFSTPDGRRQVTVAVTPGLNRDLDRVVEAFVDHAICSGRPAQP